MPGLWYVIQHATDSYQVLRQGATLLESVPATIAFEHVALHIPDDDIVVMYHVFNEHDAAITSGKEFRYKHMARAPRSRRSRRSG